jgi:prolipoprotein diacylglyceryltransferase
VPGTLFAVYLALNGLERFFIEKIRVNNRINFSAGFQPTQAEIISTLLLISGVGIFIILRRRSLLTAR